MAPGRSQHRHSDRIGVGVLGARRRRRRWRGEPARRLSETWPATGNARSDHRQRPPCLVQVPRPDSVHDRSHRPGLDTRGDGGYVIAPPSLHPSGRRYSWSVDSYDQLAAAPEWLERLARTNRNRFPSVRLRICHRPNAQQVRICKTANAYGQAALDAEIASARRRAAGHAQRRAQPLRLPAISVGRRRRARGRRGRRAPDRRLPPQWPGQGRRPCLRSRHDQERAQGFEISTLAIGCRMTELRPYQSDIIAEFDRTRETARRVILVAPTGSGKTIIAAAVIKSEIERCKNVLVLAHRREIITQTSEKLQRVTALRTASSRPAFSPRPLERVQVAAIQTLHRRAIQSDVDGSAAGRSGHRRRSHHAPAQDLSEDHRRLSRRDLARADRNAMPRRRSRARRHLRDHDRMPAGRRADRAQAIWSGRASMRRSIPI